MTVAQRWIVTGMLTLTVHIGFAADVPSALPEGAVPQGLGVNIHFTDPAAGEMEMLAAAGFSIIRMDLLWADTEKSKGKYDFAAYDRLIAALDKHHIRALFILDFDNPLYDGGASPHSDEAREAFSHWAIAAITHFGGRGILWEMWNEPNGVFWKPKVDAEAYAKLALDVGGAIRNTPAISHELYIGPGASGIDFKFLEACFKAGCLQYWDAVSVHPYREDAPTIGWERAATQASVMFNHAGDPENVLPDYAKLRELIAQYAPSGKAIPILSGEWGYSSNFLGRSSWRAYTPERQGVMLPREWLVNLMAGVNTSIWYDWRDDGPGPQDPEAHFGVVEFVYHKDRQPVYEPKPAYVAAQTFTRTLGGLKLDQILWHGEEGDYLLQFRKGPSDGFAVWSTKPAHRVTLHMAPGDYRLVSHMGVEQPLRVESDGTSLTIDEAVRYIVAK